MATVIHSSERKQDASSLRRALAIALIVGLAVVVIHALIIFVLPLSESQRRTLNDVLLVVYGYVAAGILAYASFVARKISRRVGIAWLMIAIAVAIYATGDLIKAYLGIVLQAVVYPSIADAAYLAFYIYFILGLFILPSRLLKLDERIRMLLDMSIVAISSVLLYWTLLFGPILLNRNPDPLTFIVTLAYPTMDMVLLLGVVAIMLQSGHLQSSHALLALSALVMVVSHSIFNVQYINNQYVNGSPLDLLYVVQYALAAWAGVELIVTARRWPQEIARPFDDPPVSNPLQRIPSRAIFLLPYVWIGLTFCLLIYEHVTSHENPADSTFNLVAAGLACIIILVVLRQFIQLRETSRLSADLSMLLESSRILASPIHSNDAPRIALRQLSSVLPFDRAAIAIPRDDGTIQVATATHANQQLVVQPYRTLPPTHMLWRLLDLQTLSTSDTASVDGGDADSAVNSMLGSVSNIPQMLSWMISPLVVNEVTVGLVAVGRAQPLRYTSEHASLFVAFSRQAAAAIENARLRRHETQAAAAAERSRLARELHDSVSQALFGVTLGIQTAQAVIDPNTPAREPLNYSLNLANGALSEMKALIFELRPETLAAEGLVQALRKQTDALCKRHNIDTHIDAPPSDPDISLDAKEALYRITLEAVQNTIRHAQASRVDISLAQEGKSIVLQVNDNGRGFDAKATYAGHLGLVSMRERAEQLDGTFDVSSEINKGTRIRVTMPLIESQVE